MTRRFGPHDFLLYLRGRQPALARRLDGIRGLSLGGRTLGVRVPRGSWSEHEVLARLGDFERAARSFFGEEPSLAVESTAADPEALPFPIVSSKTWNHVAFWAWDARGSAVLALRKPLYFDCWLAGGTEPPGPDVFSRRYPGGPEASPDDGALSTLPDLLDDLCELARSHMSYTQLLTSFPGDEAADRLEGRLYAVKEWGTPGTPAAVLQKYVGRIHYVSPSAPPLGLRRARALLEQGR